MSDIILYTTEDGRSQIKLRADEQTVWLTQLEMAELFDASKQNVSLHLKNLFEDGELIESSVVKESLTAQTKLNQTATTGKSSDVQTRAVRHGVALPVFPIAIPETSHRRLART